MLLAFLDDYRDTLRAQDRRARRGPAHHDAAAAPHARRDAQAPRLRRGLVVPARLLGERPGRAVGVGGLGRRPRLGLAHRGRDTPEQLRALFDAAVAAVRRGRRGRAGRRRARRLADASRHGTTLSLRWILLHMIEEYARHNGHADLIRQSIDGEVGRVTDPRDDRGRLAAGLAVLRTRSCEAGETYAYPPDLTSEQARDALDDEPARADRRARGGRRGILGSATMGPNRPGPRQPRRHRVVHGLRRPRGAGAWAGGWGSTSWSGTASRATGRSSSTPSSRPTPPPCACGRRSASGSSAPCRGRSTRAPTDWSACTSCTWSVARTWQRPTRPDAL